MKRIIVIMIITAIIMSFCCYNICADEIELPILMYHSVDSTGGMYSVTAEKLERDIKGLKKAGYTTVSFDDVIRYVEKGEKLPEKSVVITFDDGYDNNYITLLPLAEKLDFKFEVFAVAGFVGVSPYAMKWNQLKELDASYQGAVGCHTYNLHSYNADGRVGVLRLEGEDIRAWEQTFRDDLSLAKYFFMENANINPVSFAYPNGQFSSEAESVLREEGYKVTLTTEAGVNVINTGDREDLYLMLRIPMDGQAYSAVDMIKSCRKIKSSEKNLNCKKNVKPHEYVSRKKALERLYGERFKNVKANYYYINPYFDMKYTNEKARDLFAKCVENNIISGYPNWTMKPNHYITRGEFALLLARRTGYDGRRAVYKFKDAEYWNEGALSWCREKGYMIGYGEEFGVNDFLKSEHIELVMSRMR